MTDLSDHQDTHAVRRLKQPNAVSGVRCSMSSVTLVLVSKEKRALLIAFPRTVPENSTPTNPIPRSLRGVRATTAGTIAIVADNDLQSAAEPIAAGDVTQPTDKILNALKAAVKSEPQPDPPEYDDLTTQLKNLEV